MMRSGASGVGMMVSSVLGLDPRSGWFQDPDSAESRCLHSPVAVEASARPFASLWWREKPGLPREVRGELSSLAHGLWRGLDIDLPRGS